ncbi:hypothetical protein GEV33_004610 [Tenebrio molitor]|uniref:Reverse transcriptase domain-containing protein n=1 Tax=Tenebrio molitor TaxID=7067 RepID=A0A8J6LMH2_TENMO|nr:hypothetical protein GEV33_004610 [Tenebrio molitor]
MERNKGENEQIRIVFWNVAGIKNKENEFWKYLGEFDVVGLVETWVEEKRERKQERESERWDNNGCEKGTGRRKRIWSKRRKRVYGKNGKKKTEKMENCNNIQQKYERNEENNRRASKRAGRRNSGRRMEEQQATIERRPTKDGIENAEGRELVSLVEERGWDVLNGNCIGDEKGEYTYIGSRGETVIDYVMVNEEAWDEIEEFKVGERVESDHMPLEVRTKGREKERSIKDVKRKIVKNIWTEEGKEKYRARLREAKYEEEEINEKVRELSENGREASSKKETKKLKKRKSNEGRVQESTQEEWKEGIICHIYKKGEKDTASNYRGITLLNTAYKVYAMMVEERLMKEMNERGALPDGQAGFRKDLKAAFDNVERDLLWEYLRKKGINEHLVTKIEEIYEETISRVRVDGRVSECFKTYKGVRQGCPLSPSLFAAFIGDIEEMFRKGQAGGVVVGKEKVWSLAYADDLVVLAREEKGMKEMLGNMEKYMRRKKLTVNVEKSKMMVFRKGGGRRKINEWRWEKDKIEEVKEFKYLGYVMNERNTAAAHVRELVKKANKIIGAVWGIGERKFGHDFRRRIMMFDSLVKSVMMYGAEIWGWREQEGLEGVQGKYLKWVLGVDRETPGYIVMEETKRDGIRIEAGKRAMRFEERLIERGECRILQECLKEKRKEIGKGVWKEREAYFERNGYAGAEIERMREGGRAMTDELVQRDRYVQVQERRTRIRESRYNGKYEKIITEELPKYLGRESRKERVIIARFRCGNEERENKYWNEDRIRVCRMCGDNRTFVE